VRRGVRLPLEQLRPYLLDVPRPARPGGGTKDPDTTAPSPLDFASVFGNDHPVELEVGFGKGLFLITEARKRPEVNFVGVEIVRKYQLFTAGRVARRGLSNVRLACADAWLLLRDRVHAGSLQAIHVYFPDPWWKKRHHKRRVFTAEFVAACTAALRPGGQLVAATDVEAYSEVMAALGAAQPGLRPLPPPPPTAAEHDLDYLTNFERKFRMQGKPIYRLRWERDKGQARQGIASSVRSED
jgi:tRNA (guanine-N7-)-methyltransferase